MMNLLRKKNPELIKRCARKVHIYETRANIDYFLYYILSFYKKELDFDHTLNKRPGPLLQMKLKCLTNYLKNKEEEFVLEDY